MTLDLSDEETDALTRLLSNDRRRSLSVIAAHSDLEGDPHEDPAGAEAAALAAVEAL
jgi:hypothetical protein